jgi:hypothetical protein
LVKVEGDRVEREEDVEKGQRPKGYLFSRVLNDESVHQHAKRLIEVRKLNYSIDKTVSPYFCLSLIFSHNT